MKNKEKDVILLAKKLRMALAELGSNQTEIAKKMGVSKAQISHWVAGDNKPSMESLTKLATALGKPVKYFFENANNTDDITNTINFNSNTDYRFLAIEKELQLLKKDFEILKLTIEKKLEEEKKKERYK